MKTLILTLIFTGTFSASTSFADKVCKDKNFIGLKSSIQFNNLKYTKGFSELSTMKAKAFAGFSKYLGGESELCSIVNVTFLKHSNSNKTYIIYTTHNDDCDGGTTMGIIIDLDMYNAQKTEDSIVADIGDGVVSCR